MDVQTIQALVGLFMLLSTVVGGLQLVMWRQVSAQNEQFKAHQVEAAHKYVTKEEHDRRITSEINAIKDLLERVEVSVSRLLEMNQRGLRP